MNPTSLHLRLAPGASLEVTSNLAEDLLAQLRLALSTDAGSPALIHRAVKLLDDDHPLWDHHSGGDGHRGAEWAFPKDLARAEAFYASARAKGRLFMEVLMDCPGQMLDVEQLCTLRPEFTGARSIAGALNGLRVAHVASDRRYPFYWWDGRPSRYAMKPSVAELFRQVRANLRF